MKTLRLQCDEVIPPRIPTRVEDVDGNRAYFTAGDDVTFELGAFSNRALVGDLSVLRIYIIDSAGTTVYDSTDVAVTTITLANWLAGSAEHVSIALDGTDTALAKGTYRLQVVGVDGGANVETYLNNRIDVYD